MAAHRADTITEPEDKEMDVRILGKSSHETTLLPDLDYEDLRSLLRKDGIVETFVYYVVLRQLKKEISLVDCNKVFN